MNVKMFSSGASLNIVNLYKIVLIDKILNISKYRTDNL